MRSKATNEYFTTDICRCIDKAALDNEGQMVVLNGNQNIAFHTFLNYYGKNLDDS